MKDALRLAASTALLCAAALAVRLAGAPLAAAAIAAFVIHAVLKRRVSAALLPMVPVALFAAAVFFLSWLGGAGGVVIPMRTVAVFLLSTAAFRIAPWKCAASKLSPRSRLYTLGLFLLFVRHFARILAGESRRTLQARSFCVRGTLGRGGLSSLGWAVVSIFRRSLARAERFHAAQSLAGIVQ